MSEYIKNIIRNGINQYIESKRDEDVNYHVLEEIFPVERRVRSIIGGLETSFGTKVWEPLAKQLAQKNGFRVYNEKDFSMPKNLPNEIENLINIWALKRENDSKEKVSLDGYINELKNLVKSLNIDYSKFEYKKLPSGQGIDLWIEKDGIEYITDIKTTQLNKGDGKKFNRHILNWYAYRIFRDPEIEIKAFISIPFNPYSSSWEKGDGGRSKPLIFGKDIITDRAFWKVLSGSDTTYDDILKSFKEVGKENLHEKHRDIIYGDYEGKNYLEISNIKAVKEYIAVDLFSGYGGLALGLEESGFKNIGLVDIDKHACDTLRVNRPNWNVIQGDIVEIVEKGIRNYVDKDVEVDLLSGELPCQAFIYSDERYGLEDAKEAMFYNYTKILKELNPKVFLAISVKGLISHNQGKTLNTMISKFNDLGYKVEYKVLKAENYGVAQKKERLIIIGTRNDLNSEKLKFPKPYESICTLKQALKDVPPSKGREYKESKKKVLDLVPPGGYWVDLPKEVAKEYMGKSYCSGGEKRGIARRLSWDEPCLTLNSNCDLKIEDRCHPDETRPLTIREYARIQSFPDEWIFKGSVGQVYKQIANAVPVKLGKAVGLSIVDYLNRVEEN